MKGSYQRVGPSREKVPTTPGRPPGPAPAPAPAQNGKARPRPRLLQPWAVPDVTTYYVHAHGPTVRENKLSGLNRPLVLIRRSDKLNEMVLARHVELPGPSRLVHRHSMPLPETERNAVAVLETTTPPVAYFDPPGPTSLASDVPLTSCARVTLTDEEWARRAQTATHFIRR